MPTDLPYQQLVSQVLGRPADAGGWYGLGLALFEARRWGAAAGSFGRAWGLWQGDHRALTNYGWNLHLCGRSAEAAARLSEAVLLAPGEGTPHALLSQVMATLGDGTAALVHARRAVELEPGVALNHVALSFALMSLGRWSEGWREFEHRFAYKIPEFLTRPYRLWRGERVGHLYLEAEQGSGDTIFALRWLGEAASRADRVTLYVHGPLYSLVAGWSGLPANVRVLPLPRPLPDGADAWCPLMSLPAALEDGAAGPGSLDHHLGRYVWIADAVRPDGDGLHVGICWAGNPTHEQSHHRDCPLSYWLRLTEMPGVVLHSLQVGERAADLTEALAYGLVLDRSPEITNFEDTARIIAGLDLVVTVDTAVGHLAGALGKPCWLLLNQRGRDFRWGYEGDGTPWYPGHRVFRRSLDDDWGAVMDRVGVALREKIGA